MNAINNRLSLLITLALLCISANVYSQAGKISINYFDQTPPGSTAKVFAPDFISANGVFAQNGIYSPDGKEFYYTVSNGKWDHFEIWGTKSVNGRWTAPVPANIFGGASDSMEPFYSPDGKRIYFNSGNMSGTDIWYIEKTGDAWSKPVKIPAPVNTAGFEWYPTVSNKNTLFLTRNGDILFFPSPNGRFITEVNIGYPVNSTEYEEADPFISPNEDYLIFHSNGRPGGYGQGDLYISYKKENGQWTNPKNLGPKINTGEFEFGPSVTPDGKYFQFSRRQKWLTDIPSKIYWMKADFIDSLKHTNFAPYLKNKISNQSAVAGQKFSFTLPDDTFIDDDGNSTLTYSASLSNGNSLPAWLSFDSVKRTFSGIPKDAEKINIKVTVTDKADITVYSAFAIDVLK